MCTARPNASCGGLLSHGLPPNHPVVEDHFSLKKRMTWGSPVFRTHILLLLPKFRCIWLVVDLPLRKIWLRQLGWWHSQYMESHKNSMVPNHQPVINWFKLSRFRPGPVHPKVSTVSQSHSQPVALDLRQPLSQIHSLAQSVPWLCRLKSKRCTPKIWCYYSLDWIKGKSTGNPYIR